MKNRLANKLTLKHETPKDRERRHTNAVARAALAAARKPCPRCGLVVPHTCVSRLRTT